MLNKMFISYAQNVVQIPKFFVRTSQQTILNYRQQDGTKKIYTREMLKQRYDNEVNKTQIEAERKRKETQERQNKLLQRVSNEKNPSNLVAVKINGNILTNQSLITSPAVLQQIQIQSQLKKPFIILKQPRPEQILITGIRRNVDVSIKRMRPIINELRKQHLFEALSIAQNSGTQSGRYFYAALNQVMNHAKVQNLILDRLYVNGIVVGKQRRFHKIRFHAKGSHGKAQKDICQIKITLQEQPVKQMYQQIISGHTPPILALFLREKLMNQNAQLSSLRQFGFITTARGRQQRRLMIQRLALQQFYQYKAQGVNVPIQVITAQIVEDEAIKWSSEYEKTLVQVNNQKLGQRTQLFKKNQDATQL